MDEMEKKKITATPKQKQKKKSLYTHTHTEKRASEATNKISRFHRRERRDAMRWGELIIEDQEDDDARALQKFPDHLYGSSVRLYIYMHAYTHTNARHITQICLVSLATL